MSFFSGARFRPPVGFSIFTVVGVGILWSLCTWQLGRREDARVEREVYEARLASPAFDALNPPDNPEFRRVQASGAPDWTHVQRVIGRYMWSQPGMQLLLPLRLESGQSVLVDIGWVPEDEADAIIAREAQTSGVRTYAGIARPFVSAPDARLTDDAAGHARWRSVSPEGMGSASGVTVPAWVIIDGQGLTDEQEISDRVPPVSGWRLAPVQRPHGEYAFTWFSLGMTLLLVWLSLSFSSRGDRGLSARS
jgi:cytochrome oxidase assembly protein ShyY1